MVPLPFVTPPLWPDVKLGRFAHAILRNGPELLEDRDAGAEIRKCSVALFGLADDLGVELNHGRVGAAQGPNAFRAALSRYGVAEPGGENGSIPWEWPRVFDIGNIIPAAGNDEAALHETHRRVTETVRAVLEMSEGRLFPIAIGGGHDLTFPFVRGVTEFWASRAASIHSGLYFDAHLDVRPTVGSGMPFRRLIETCAIRDLTIIGANSFANSREHWGWFTQHGGHSRTLADLPTIAAPNGPAFISLDLDVLDASAAPGVSALNPCGLLMPPLCAAVESLAANAHIRCFDLMELNPLHDDQHRTARAAAHLFLTFLKGLASRGAHPSPSQGTRA